VGAVQIAPASATCSSKLLIIIHAEGVRFDVPSSAPQARKTLSLLLDTRFPGGRRAGPVFLKSWMSISCPLAKTALFRPQAVPVYKWCWASFREQSTR
jgi:hypothetical protein